MKKRVFLLATCPLIFAISVAALDFEPITLGAMVRSAELAVSGRVTAASAKSVTLSVSDQLFGPDIGREVTILRNKDWSGAPGLGIFRIGQQLVLLAGRSRDSVGADEPRWRTLGIENEAVLPIDENQVFFSGDMPGLEMETHDLDGITVSAHPFNLSAFTEAVRGYRECVGPVGQDAASAEAEIRCPDSEFAALRNGTALGRLLTEPLVQE